MCIRDRAPITFDSFTEEYQMHGRQMNKDQMCIRDRNKTNDNKTYKPEIPTAPPTTLG